MAEAARFLTLYAPIAEQSSPPPRGEVGLIGSGHSVLDPTTAAPPVKGLERIRDQFHRLLATPPLYSDLQLRAAEQALARAEANQQSVEEWAAETSVQLGRYVD